MAPTREIPTSGLGGCLNYCFRAARLAEAQPHALANLFDALLFADPICAENFNQHFMKVAHRIQTLNGSPIYQHEKVNLESRVAHVPDWKRRWLARKSV